MRPGQQRPGNVPPATVSTSERMASMRPGQQRPGNFFAGLEDRGGSPASMRPGQQRPGNDGAADERNGEFVCFNEAGATTPRKLKSVEYTLTVIGQLQ